MIRYQIQPSIRFIIVGIFLFLACFSGDTARAQPNYSGDVLDTAFQASDVLYIKFNDDSGFYLDGKQLKSKSGDRILSTEPLADLGYWRYVHHASFAQLTEMRDRAQKNLGTSVYDPSSEFYFYLDNKADILLAKKIIAGLPSVQAVYFVPRLFLATPPDLVPGESYLQDVPSGINANQVRATYQNKGAGIKICDIEYSYNPNHDDLPSITLLGGTPSDPFGDDNHGTATIGEMAALDNGFGTTGIASDAEFYFAGAFVNNTYNVSSAITSALTELDSGDVILLEQQIGGPNSGSNQYGLVPVEWYKPYFDAIQLATALNVTVVEAAGNGSQNLDSASYATGNNGHYPFQSGGINSGAIIVGAGAVGGMFNGSDVERSRLWYSNYGSRVNVQGNGENVFTTGYGDAFSAEGYNRRYTATFGGTSSASPIIAGAVALLQAVSKQETGRYLTPEQVRHYLTSEGKPQKSGMFPLTQHIGPLPDLLASVETALEALAITETIADEPEFVIAPNPSKGIFTLSTKSLAEFTINIYDMLGRKITSKLIQNNGQGTVGIDISSQPDGMYLLKVMSKNKSSSYKLVLFH
jgi:subtilisin family serine protease